jgi:hypothetical protein
MPRSRNTPNQSGPGYHQVIQAIYGPKKTNNRVEVIASTLLDFFFFIKKN